MQGPMLSCGSSCKDRACQLVTALLWRLLGVWGQRGDGAMSLQPALAPLCPRSPDPAWVQGNLEAILEAYSPRGTQPTHNLLETQLVPFPRTCTCFPHTRAPSVSYPLTHELCSVHLSTKCLSLHVQTENRFVRERCFWFLLSKG